MRDTTHLVALETRLSHERARLAAAKTVKEAELRGVWVHQIQREIADERAFLDMDLEPLDDMTDAEILAELGF